MAIGVYVQIDGIEGESADCQHAGWIECASVNWKLRQPKSATSSTAGGHTAERAELSDVVFTKLCDLASPILAQHCAMGKTIPKTKFEFSRTDGQGTRVKYYEAELDNVVVGEVSQSVSAGVGMVDHIGLKFSKVKWKYTQQKIAVPAVQAQDDEHPFIMPGTPAKTIPATSPWFTGAQLLRQLEQGDAGTIQYLKGVYDATESGLWCYTDRRKVKLPKQSPEAMRTDTVTYLHQQPAAKLKERAAVLIVQMWQDRWPCPPDGCCP